MNPTRRLNKRDPIPNAGKGMRVPKISDTTRPADSKLWLQKKFLQSARDNGEESLPQDQVWQSRHTLYHSAGSRLFLHIQRPPTRNPKKPVFDFRAQLAPLLRRDAAR